MNKQPTIYDVAELAGVSIATVSRVMGGKTASEQAQRKVKEAIEKLNYRPVASAHPLCIGQSSRVLGIVISDLENPYYASMLGGAQREAAASDYSLQVYVNDLSHQADEGIVSRLLRQTLDGVVMAGSMIENGEDVSREAILRISTHMPVVTIGPIPQGTQCANMGSDLSLSVRKSLDYLASLGHRRIAFIGGNPDGRSSRTRERAFMDEIARRGLSCPDPKQNETGYTPEAGEMCVMRLFEGLDKHERPTALIAINDLVALGAMRQVRRLGLRIPEDVSIIGCDNQFFAPYLEPPLTTVDLHPAEHGRTAIRQLVAACSGGRRYSYTQLRECSLILRGSCGPAPAETKE